MRCEVGRVASFIFVMQPLGRRGVAVLLLSQPQTLIGANLLIYLQKNKKHMEGEEGKRQEPQTPSHGLILSFSLASVRLFAPYKGVGNEFSQMESFINVFSGCRTRRHFYC